MGKNNMPDIAGRAARDRDKTGLSAEVTSIENGEEEHIRKQARKGMLEQKQRQYLGQGANAVTDAVQTDGDNRFINTVDRHREEREASRPEEDADEIAAFLRKGRELRAEAFGQVAKLTAEEAGAIALRPNAPYVPPAAPPPAPVQPPAKKKMIVVTKGGRFRPDKVEEFEV